MADPPPGDPAAMFRQMLGQWEAMANRYGGEAMKSGEFAQGLHAANAARMAGEAQLREWMGKALAAANLPSRADIDALAGRLAAIEASLARIEAALADGAAGSARPHPARPQPARTRQPPRKDRD